MMRFKQFLNEAWDNEKQAELVNHIKNGLSNKEIAAKMNVTPNNIKQVKHRYRERLNIQLQRNPWEKEELKDLEKHASNPDISHKEIARRLNSVHDNDRNEEDVKKALKNHLPNFPKRSGKGQRIRWNDEALQALKASHKKHKGSPVHIGKDMDIAPNEISAAIGRYGHEIGITKKVKEPKE